MRQELERGCVFGSIGRQNIDLVHPGMCLYLPYQGYRMLNIFIGHHFDRTRVLQNDAPTCPLFCSGFQ